MRVAFFYNFILKGVLPFGLTTLASIIKSKGHEFAYFDAEDEYELLKSSLEEYAPDVFGFSASTSCYSGYIALSRRLKEDFPDVKIVFGGPHPTLCPEIIEEESCIDMLCVGEADDAFPEYLEALSQGGAPKGIANLWLRQSDGSIDKNEARPFIQDLDSVPFPDYSFVNVSDHLQECRIAYIMAGRGCPYKCSYCINHILRDVASGRYVRYRSVDNVVEEIKQIVDEWGMMYVSFQDDIFGTDINWLREFAEKYPKEVGLPYTCHQTANLINEERADLLRDSGCDLVVIGLENGDEELRRTVLNKVTKDEDIIRTGHLLRDRGVKLLTQNMIGLPGETLQTALKTIELNIRCDVFVFNMWFFQPYPMVKLTEKAEQMGIMPPNYDFPSSMAAAISKIALDLPNKETLQLLGELAYYLVEHPRRFKATKWVVTIFGGTWPTRLWLRRHLKIQGPRRRSYDHYFQRWLEAAKKGEDVRAVSI